MALIETSPLTCWECAADVPTARYPSPFCSDDCLHEFWGPDTSDCRACGAHTVVCASPRNVIARARCCEACDHTPPDPDPPEAGS